MDEVYRWDDASYTSLAAAGVAWPDVIHVLHHGYPRIRKHIGAALFVATPDRPGRS
nr:hypothetical protein [Micromonospora sp. DSM 115978]